MAGTINVNQLIPDPGQDLYINTGQYGANLVVGNATTQLLVVSPQGILSSGGTSALGVPTGTTAQRPANPVVGYIRFNTDTQLLENYTANGWVKVSVNTPTITSISGTIYSGNTSTLTINGTNFGSGLIGSVTYTAGANTASVSATPTSETLLTTTVPATVYGWAAGTSVAVTFTNSGGGTSPAYNMVIAGLPTGGTITTSGNTRIHSFTSSGTFTVPTGFSATASYLIVAGGGGGSGDLAGGGGAGGMRTGTTSLSVGSYSITVGGGGNGGSAARPPTGVSAGSDSSGFSQTSIGGGNSIGYSSSSNRNGVPGGSGGGGSGYEPSYSSAGGSGTPGQGNNGGSGATSPGYAQGGGGGAGAVGGNGTSSPGGTAGSGGVGLSSSITGSPVYYAGGGGGGAYTGGSTNLGPGGNGGGGNGGQSGNATAGTTNTGGGGGGGGYNGGPPALPTAGGAGGSGIVIVSYNIP